MRCVAITITGKAQCSRRALPGGRLCRAHSKLPPERLLLAGDRDVPREDGPARGQRPFYSSALEEGALGLEVAAVLRGVDDEIAVLRMLIRKVARDGDLEATRRGIETLCRALKVQYALEGRSAEGLAGSLARVLDEMGNELGMSL